VFIFSQYNKLVLVLYSLLAKVTNPPGLVITVGNDCKLVVIFYKQDYKLVVIFC